jgi:hypothetical protein
VADRISITAPERYLRVLRADDSQLSRHLTIEEAIESAANAPPGEYRIVYPDRIVKAYGVLPSTPAPAAPTELTVEEFTAGYVTLSWGDDGNGTSWTVYRDGTPIGSVSSQSYTDTNVAPSTLYSYQVQASNSSGSSSLSDAQAVTTPANTAPVWSITDLSAVLGQAYTLNLSSVCADDDGHTLSFTLPSGSVPGLLLSNGVYSGTPNSAGAYALTFRVSDGYTAVDAPVTLTVSDPDVTAPTVPTGVSASANGSTVTVSWTASTDASGVATYRIYRDGALRASQASSPYVESGVPVGTYSYTVAAVDASSNANASAQSSASVVSVVPANPDTPINFTATAVSSTQINLSWAPGPNGAVPDDYDLDFATNANGPWTAITFVGTATTYSHTGRTAGTTYYYRVRAGLGAVESGYATANATPNTAQFIIPGNVATWNAAASQPKVGGGTGVPTSTPNVIIELSAGTSTDVATAGTRTANGLTIQNLDMPGSAATVRNPAAGVVTVAGSVTFLFQFTGTRVRNVTIDGSNGGQSLGIRVRPSASDSYSGQALKIKGWWQNLTIRNVEVDNRRVTFNGQNLGVGISVNDAADLAGLSGGVSKWKENLLIENCEVHHIGGEGMYLGANYKTTNPETPLRNCVLRNNYVHHTGRDGINYKNWFEGVNLIYGNRIEDCGINFFDVDLGQRQGITGLAAYADVYDNIVIRTGENGIKWYTSIGPPTNQTFWGGNYGPYPEWTARAYNNLVVDAGEKYNPASPGYDATATDDRGVGISFGSANGMVPIRPYAFNNTVVSAYNDGIDANNNCKPGFIRNNVLVNNGSTFSTGSGGTTAANNKTTATNFSLTTYRLTAEDAASGTPGTDISTTDLDGVSRAGTASKGAYEFAGP